MPTLNSVKAHTALSAPTQKTATSHQVHQLLRSLQQEDGTAVTSTVDSADGSGPARTSCDAAYSAPCSRVNSKWLATKTAQAIVEQDALGDTNKVFQDVTDGRFNMETNFFPFVFEIDTGVCVGHGANPNWVGQTLSQIFDEMGIGFSLPDELHQRFIDASRMNSVPSLEVSNTTVATDIVDGGGWVPYMWRAVLPSQQEDADDATSAPIMNKIAFIVSATPRYYVGVGYNNQELPWDLPCSDKYDSWCSVNNVRSLVGKAETRINEAVNLGQFETVLYDMSFDREQYFIPGGHYLFMYRYDGPLKAHAHLSRFAGQPLEVFFKDLNREPAEGAALH
eukprot:CAMPEP_0178743034 /NCGR_PEP_ID=MMETSP0744-20121128/5993_1 /TAXON_ID=913974 /ORGANISM="Nitzschia punctata, Strain CCMP561" /LENGTH=336 /DNA_ID=CAMNT_0020396017 /DNA_START=130 /DNA_END=1137 /DNA_ORIENTATION=+